MSAAIECIGVEKSYGQVVALRGADLSIPVGGIFGVVGPNGAGKTTLFSIIAGFLGADRGTVRVAGHAVSPASPPRRGSLAILPQDARLSAHMPIRALLAYYAELAGVDDRAAARAEAERVLSMVQLGEQMGRTIDALSHGQRKRVGIAQAFLCDPQVILLDEPTAGLDPHVAGEIRASIRAIQAQQTVIVSSHNLAEVEDLCGAVAILHQGKVVRQDTLAALVGEAAEVAFRMAQPPVEELLAGLRALPFVTRAEWDVRAGRLRVGFDPASTDADAAARDLVGFFVEQKVAFVEMQVGKGLEERFLEETR